jgi:hypothetical protein
MNLERERSDAERHADRVQMQMEFLRSQRQSQLSPVRPPPRHGYNMYTRIDTRYPEGGGSTMWSNLDGPDEFLPAFMHDEEPAERRYSSHQFPSCQHRSDNSTLPRHHSTNRHASNPLVHAAGFNVSVSPSHPHDGLIAVVITPTRRHVTNEEHIAEVNKVHPTEVDEAHDDGTPIPGWEGML